MTGVQTCALPIYSNYLIFVILVDKRVNVRCVDFINKISRGGSKMETLTIKNLTQKSAREYVFEYDTAFGYLFEEK